jgi:cell division protein FtsB
MMEKIKNAFSKINWTDKRLIAIVIVVLLVFLMMGFNNRLINMNRLTKQENILQTRIAGLESTKIAVEERIAYATSEVALEEWARESNHLIEPGDQAIVLIAPDKVQATPTPMPVPEEKTSLSNFETWKLLLFGED